MHQVALFNPVSTHGEILCGVIVQLVEITQVFDLIQKVVRDTQNNGNHDDEDDGQFGSGEAAPLVSYHVVTHKDVPETTKQRKIRTNKTTTNSKASFVHSNFVRQQLIKKIKILLSFKWK